MFTPSGKRHLGILVAAIAFATVTTSAHAKKITLKSGLWRIDSQSFLYGHQVPDVQSILALGPGALQDHANQMMQQNHVAIDGNGVVTVCLSPTRIAMNDFVNANGSGCEVGKPRRIGNTLYYNIECQAPPGGGQAQVNILSRTEWKSTAAVNVTIRGVPQELSNQSTGTWLSAKCPAGQ